MLLNPPVPLLKGGGGKLYLDNIHQDDEGGKWIQNDQNSNPL